MATLWAEINPCIPKMCNRQIRVEFERSFKFAFSLRPIPVVNRRNDSRYRMSFGKIGIEFERFGKRRFSRRHRLLRRHKCKRRHNHVRLGDTEVSQGIVWVELYRFPEKFDTAQTSFPR